MEWSAELLANPWRRKVSSSAAVCLHFNEARELELKSFSALNKGDFIRNSVGVQRKSQAKPATQDALPLYYAFHCISSLATVRTWHEKEFLALLARAESPKKFHFESHLHLKSIPSIDENFSPTVCIDSKVSASRILSGNISGLSLERELYEWRLRLLQFLWPIFSPQSDHKTVSTCAWDASTTSAKTRAKQFGIINQNLLKLKCHKKYFYDNRNLLLFKFNTRKRRKIRFKRLFAGLSAGIMRHQQRARIIKQETSIRWRNVTCHKNPGPMPIERP